MKAQAIPRVLIAYPSAFACYDKFERKVSNILSSISNFYIVHESDPNEFVARRFSSDQRVCGTLNSPVDEGCLSNATHAVIFNDGTTFNDLIGDVKKRDIKARIIDAAITKVVNIRRTKEYDVYIGRGSPWGNPYAIGRDGDRDREEVIRKYSYDFERGLLKTDKENFRELAGKTLGCYCKPEACHGDVIAAHLNALDDGK